uniref:DUF3120 domain-containing protein n=1 Tax=Paulinella chromatophora TaxID=39717 RepID=B1X456_PAUCH|nr:hypothetical protein PCC_0283 [Paulinella chromatophora]ACB42725.1 hypothetical protein PCC_0283 [Paulinella chromatophora]
MLKYMKNDSKFNDDTSMETSDYGSLNLEQQLDSSIAFLSAIAVALPVFIQAPWVRLAPFSASCFTVVLLIGGILLECEGPTRWREKGVLLVGFSGSWLGGCLFWRWYRLHPVWHLPLEGFAMPLAIAGINSRWQLASFFYLASLAGTAITDAIILIMSLMNLWPIILSASAEAAPTLLQKAARAIFHPPTLLLMLLTAAGLTCLSKVLWRKQSHPGWRVAASALATTLVVDSLFLATALVSPQLSGLI